MDRFLAGYAAVLHGMARAERVVATGALALIVGCIFAQVVSRYLFNRPLVWVEELSTYAFIWGTFIGAALGVKEAQHIKIHSFVGRLPPGPARALRTITHLLIGVFALVLVVNGIKAMLLFEWHQRTIALPVELPRYLFYSMPLVVGALSIALTAAYDVLRLLADRPATLR